MVSFYTPVARQVAIAFDLSGVARVACLRFAHLSLRTDYGVNLGLGEVGDGRC